MLLSAVLGALIDLESRQRSVRWGRLDISVANLTVIAVMVVVFVLAVVLPRPGGARKRARD
jgi:hypothetical protein